MDQDTPLAGGNLNAVQRRGDTVIRPAGPWSPTIHRLLRHVRERGVTWVPQPFAIENGFEQVGFMAGEVAHGAPDWLWPGHLLVEVAQALRQWHDATADFDRADARWQSAPRAPQEVICHCDFAPYNCVFGAGPDGHHFVGAIDFDTCLPGPRLWDLAYTAYRFVPLMPAADVLVEHAGDERAPFDWPRQQERLRVFLDAYALHGQPMPVTSVAELLGAVVERLLDLAVFSDGAARRLDKPELARHAAMYRRHADWLSARTG
ncbi:aminoglycoside phosphotransferase family protein [Niveibacterium sp. SC-1]|uniref:aminoglycoside phosphotransferase family protein n=1 Tax=Niveibacterium sp. SC-1 TaxID=3135646 RepID=UPI00311DA28D